MAWFPENMTKRMLLRGVTCYGCEKELALQFVSSADIADRGLPLGVKSAALPVFLKSCDERVEHLRGL